MRLIGDIIREKRRNLKLKQSELADIIGVSESTVSGWENNYFFPNVIWCIAMADLFKCTLDELCDRKFGKGNAK